MDELLREAADSIMAGLVDRMPTVGEGAGLDGASAVCRDLRQVLVTHPGAARVMASGPSRMENERAFTERLLGLLGEAGLSDEDTVFGYHALVEFTVGSAAIDALEPAPSSDEEAARHRRWRADYLTASPDVFPQTVRLANELYPSMSEQFEFGAICTQDDAIATDYVQTHGAVFEEVLEIVVLPSEVIFQSFSRADVLKAVDRSRDLAARVPERTDVHQGRYSRPVWTLYDHFGVSSLLAGNDGIRHRAVLVRERRPVDQIELV